MNSMQPLFYDVLNIDVSQHIPIRSIDDGRWHLTPNYDLYDSQLNILYPRPADVPLHSAFWPTVTDLTTTGVSLIFLFTLALKPLTQISRDKLLDPAYGLKVHVTSGQFRADPNQVFWSFPTTGISHSSQGGAYCHVPGATDVIVNPTGNVRSVSRDVELLPGTNRGGRILIKTEMQKEIEISVAQLVLLAYGGYQYHNLDKSIIYINGNDQDYVLTNLALDPTLATDVAVVETDADKLRIVV